MNMMRTLRFLLLIVCCPLLTSGFYAEPASAAEPTGEEIMRRAEEQQGGWEDEVAKVTFLMIKGEKNATRRIVSRKRKNDQGKNGLNKRTLLFFQYPPMFRRVVYLSWNHMEEGKGNDTWLYTPSTRKVRRLNPDLESRSLYFLFEGIDFTFSDLFDRPVTQDTHRVLRQETYNYKDCHDIESLPRDVAHPYSKLVSWIWKDRGLPVKVNYYDQKDSFRKTLFYHYWAQVQGVWFPKQLLLKDHKREHTTLLFVSSVQYNTGLNDTLFVPSNLEYTR